MTRVVTFAPDMPSLGSAVVAIGVFDGVHLGHQMLVRDAIAVAREREALAVVLTFDRDPDRVVMPESAAPQLLSLADKVRLLSALEPDVVLVVPFDAGLASLTPEAFIRHVLLAATAPLAVIVGCDFRFGTRASGTIETLESAGLDHGFDVRGHALLEVDGQPVTSTRIRSALARGEVKEAAALLGRRHFITGDVVRGRGVGRGLGVPTANIATHSWTALPLDGVYAGRAHVGGATYDCAVSVGLPPSFPEAEHLLEVHLLDYSGAELYDESLEVEFVARVRSQRRFDDERALTDAIATDIQAIRGLLHP